MFFKQQLSKMIDICLKKKKFNQYHQEMGSFRSEPELTKHTIHEWSRDHSYAVCHMCGWRKFMEDASVSISPFTYRNYSLFCVFDGHGGPQVALYAEKKFPKLLQENKAFKNGQFEEGLRQTFLKIDELLMAEEGAKDIQQLRKQQIAKNNSSDSGSLRRVGCTALAVLVTKQWVYVANAGDCRAVACTYSGEIKQLSNDHKPQNPDEQKRIKDAGGYIEYGRVNGCLNLSRAFGDLQFKQNKSLKLEQQIITSDPQITKISRNDLYFIIMGCDGIWESKSSQNMAQWIKLKLSARIGLNKILQELLDTLVAKTSKDESGTDNMSSILIKFDKRP